MTNKDIKNFKVDLLINLLTTQPSSISRLMQRTVTQNENKEKNMGSRFTFLLLIPLIFIKMSSDYLTDIECHHN